MKTFDLIVIGWGKGGKTLAGEAAARGERVAVIERSHGMYGGTCINVGCIPSKSLVNSAAHAACFGLRTFDDQARFYREAIAEKRRLTAMLRGKMYAKLHDFSNVEVFDGVGGFVSAREVRVTGEAGEQVIRGERIVIDTGSRPVLPEIIGLAGNPLVYTSETLLELDRLPRRLLIVGGGYIGLEFASIYAGFGSKVTLLQHGDVFLPREDPDIASEIAGVLAAKGITIITGGKPVGVSASGGVASLAYRDSAGREQVLDAEAVLIATGRRPNLDGLHPERAGIEVTPRGAVAVDELLRTNVPGIWAVGDVTGGLQFTYVSLDDSRIVRPQLFGLGKGPTAAERKNVPYSVFLAPPYSRVGLNEREARERGFEVRIAKLPAAAVPKAQVLRETGGMLKAVIDGKSGRILGAMLFCAESHEVINLVKLAMDMDLPYTMLRDRIYTHPVMSEALNDLFGAV